ncbi:hypothetical protein [uncultured Bifidobacterium sp.]|uniref:hypothetical protein n=1 Tax=uncultured Bifidobacterium sp. TaxID=165187 RepID=UPI0025FFB5A3|nr:hypothetical protein [uncultured Bifidobacterium sp.]
MGTPKDPEEHRNYSIGMRQGLILARYMMTLYLLDEPLNGPDPAAIGKLRDSL